MPKYMEIYPMKCGGAFVVGIYAPDKKIARRGKARR